MAHSIRPATAADVDQMLAIYAPVVRETAITWEYEPPSGSEFVSRLKKVQDGGYPWIVLVDGDTILGYAYAGSFRDRYGYRFCCESTIYMSAESRGRGLGKRLYGTLIQILERQGFVSVIGGLAYPNPGSQALHTSLGFRMIGIHEGIGLKFDRWHSMCFMQRDFGHDNAKGLTSPRSFKDLMSSGELDDLVC